MSSQIKKKKFYAAGTLIEGYDGKIVLFQKTNSTTYSLPFGKKEKGETPEETAIRETFEETGLDVLVSSDNPFAAYKSEDKFCYVFRARVYSSARAQQKTDEGSWRWGSPGLLILSWSPYLDFNKKMLKHFGY